jgi:hypothetical protein
MKLWVNVCFHYVENRLSDFNQVIETLNQIDGVKIIVNSNKNFDDNLNIHVAENLADPFHLTWEHKKYMQSFLQSHYTHFAYIEGNILFGKRQMDYWLKTKDLFERNNMNFIPALHRIEKDFENEIYSLDCTRTINTFSKLIVEGQEFVSIPEPYQGMFIMDKEMVEEHINSDYFNLGQKHNYGIRESANLGNMYINVPPTFSHRMMTPLQDFSDTFVHHITNNYINNPHSPHAKIKVENLFV